MGLHVSFVCAVLPGTDSICTIHPTRQIDIHHNKPVVQCDVQFIPTFAYYYSTGQENLRSWRPNNVLVKLLELLNLVPSN